MLKKRKFKPQPSMTCPLGTEYWVDLPLKINGEGSDLHFTAVFSQRVRDAMKKERVVKKGVK